MLKKRHLTFLLGVLFYITFYNTSYANPVSLYCPDSTIVNYNPVIITADLKVNNTDYEGHAWVIDGCVDITTTTTYYSTYYAYDEGASYPPNCEYLTDDEVRSVYPNVYDGMEVIDSSQLNITQYLLMNYGWDGTYDSGHYSILTNSTDWALGLNYHKLIFYNLSTGQLY